MNKDELRERTVHRPQNKHIHSKVCQAVCVAYIRSNYEQYKFRHNTDCMLTSQCDFLSNLT